MSLARNIRSALVGYGPLEKIMQRTDITDVLIHGDGRVFIDSAAGMTFVGKLFNDATCVRSYAQRLAMQAGRRLDDAQPYVDAKLADGNRMHALLPPIAVGGPQLSIRIPNRKPFSFAELVTQQCLTLTAAADLKQLIANRDSFLVIGATGAGKTSLLASMLGEVSPTERMVVVEESTELRIEHPHVVQLEAKPATADGVGAIGMSELVRQTLRMRPDRIVIGEIRGAEVLELLLAINTGHSGSAATLHANSAIEVPARIAALGLLAGISPELSGQWLLHGISKIIQIKKISGLRVVTAIAEANQTTGFYEVIANYEPTSLRAA
jgi:pilus assembly protein CpaF